MSGSRTERVLVSGATSGIGKAVAVRLAARAAAVGVIGRREDAAKEVALLAREQGSDAEVLITDISKAEQVASAVMRFVTRFGGIDTVVSCAGIAIAAPVADFEVSAWENIVSTNLGGTFYLAKYTIPQLLRTRGSFTAISSDAGTQGAQGYGAYCATKHGVNGLVKCMALDYGSRGVRFNSVCPGFVETPMADRLFEGMSGAELDYYRRSVPLGRFASAEEVASIVAHLSSHEAAYTNGMMYALDGGSTAGYYSAPAQNGA